MKKLVSILILAFCVLGMSAQNVVMKVEVNGTQEAEQSNGERIKLSGVLTLPKDAFKTITFEEKGMSVAVNAVSSPHTTATVSISFTGEPLSDIKEYGVRYALSEDQLDNGEKKEVAGAPEKKSEDVLLMGLTANTDYVCQAYALFNGEEIVSNVASFTTGDAENVNFPIPEPVDLGLPSGTKWSPWNLGSPSEPTDSGRYCGWGDKTASIMERDPIYYAGGMSIDTIASKEYDPATHLWKGEWRMPVLSDYQELYQYCTVSLDDYNGVIIFTSKENGNSITVPLAGYKSDVTHNVEGIGNLSQSAYWLGEATDTSHPDRPLRIKMSTSYSDYNVGTELRYKLYQIRPVYGKIVRGGTTPGEDTEDKDAWKKLDHYVYDGDKMITAVPQDGVDLGLPSGTKWAAWNVGALPFDKNGNLDYGIFGRYYAWGDLEERETYSQGNYSSEYAGKPCYNLPSTHDIASVLWGEDWQSPTTNDFSELFETQSDGTYAYVSVSWVQIKKGVYGYKITSKKYPDNYIYLQAAGFKSSLLLNNPPTGHYWSNNGSSLSGKTRTHANHLDFSEDSAVKTSASLDRYFGCQVRPVKKKK